MKKLKTVLLIDDSKASNMIHLELLKEMDIAENIIIKHSGKEALNYLKGGGESELPVPELIFLDIEMPEMDGFEFLEEFNLLDPKYTNNFQIVIAMLSNHLDTENYDRSKDYKMIGVLDHIRKPIYKEDVENLLEEYFEE